MNDDTRSDDIRSNHEKSVKRLRLRRRVLQRGVRVRTGIRAGGMDITTTATAPPVPTSLTNTSG